MATSSITANFYTDDPKAANAIVHALFTQVKPSPRLPKARTTRNRTPAQVRAAWSQLDKSVAAPLRGSRDRKNRIEYFVTCIGDFASRRKMTPADAYAFLCKYKGLKFLSECYDVEHTQSIEDSVSDAEDVCRRHGGVCV